MSFPRRLFVASLAVVLGFYFGLTIRSQPAASLEALFSKTEVMVPMRDGVRLHTLIYQPKDVKDMQGDIP